MFCILLWLSLLWTIAQSRLNLFDAIQDTTSVPLQFDCLHHFQTFPERAIQYCVRPANDNVLLIPNFHNMRDQNFTFVQLRALNISAQELLLWSTSTDLAENYQDYLNQPNASSLSTEVFFNCTIPWFGSRCQYSFPIWSEYDKPSVTKIVDKMFQLKSSPKVGEQMGNLTCYIHLKCDRGGTFVCLDWREVCNGRIDCLDGGADEAQCFDLEINECGEDEFRCSNGICIPKEFFDSLYLLESVITVCLDTSDKAIVPYDDLDQCMTDPNSYCEDHMCRPGLNEFSCGDGQCVSDFDICLNGRHHLLIESINIQGNLSYHCWIAMSCLTKIQSRIDNQSCEQLIISSNILAFIDTCESVIPFPIGPVLFGHIRFLYRKTSIQHFNSKQALRPDYVCYDEDLCDFLTSTYRHGIYTCRHALEMGLASNNKYVNWSSIVNSLKPSFRGCSLRKTYEKDISNSTLYCCKNSSKCISKHRIVDGIEDCYMGDDENELLLNCSITDTNYDQCALKHKCRLSLYSPVACKSAERFKSFHEIEFKDICDGFVDILPMMIDGQNYTDETECDHWSCNNLYTQCNFFQNCPNGEDEKNCSVPFCPPDFFPCASPHNYALTCLPPDRVGNGVVDCLGALDEVEHCQLIDSVWSKSHGFRCKNHTKCVRSADICDTYADCPLGDDEAFCMGMPFLCNDNPLTNRSNAANLLCRFASMTHLYFSQKTTQVYPEVQNNKIIAAMDEWPVLEQTIVSDHIMNKSNDDAWKWLCNRGLYFRFWLGNNDFTYRCLCPPSYYGNKCQYQSQRVNLLLQFRLIDRHTIYAIFVKLIDDNNQEINSYEEAIVTRNNVCINDFSFYLLYSTRPKSNTKNYSIHIDAFLKTSLIYLASWYLPIPFSFVPVHQLSAILTVPAHPISTVEGCPLMCHHGKCLKYVNVDKFFCQCHRSWTGRLCDVPLNCSQCSFDSVCAGSFQNRPICICPISKFGRRCLITHVCPPKLCKNDGQCVITFTNMGEAVYVCICSEQFGGWDCSIHRSKVEIYWQGIEMSSYMLLYFAVTNTGRDELTTVEPKKISTFQRIVTLYGLAYTTIIFVKVDRDYYLALVQKTPFKQISTSISPSQRCAPIDKLLSSTVLALPRIRRIKYYYLPCQTHLNLPCFYDEAIMCLCDLNDHPNCFKFDHNVNLTCQHNLHCQNGGQCLENNPICVKHTICVCSDCFFGDHCQFYAKGIGLTLDDMLRFEIRQNTSFNHQTLPIKMSAALVIAMFTFGLINSIFSFLTFHGKESRRVGCGMYLLASSGTSLLTICMLIVKFWFLVLTQMNASANRSVLRAGCIMIEPILKLFFSYDNWLNASVSIERAITALQGTNFNQAKSKIIAKWVILFLPFFIAITLIHEPLYRNLFDDHEEQRVWCVTYYSHSVQNYNTAILFFHFLVPFMCNLFSAIVIIFIATRHHAAAQPGTSYVQHLRHKLMLNKHILISPVVLIILAGPRLIIAMPSDCLKASRNPWLYLSGYFISFIPSVLIFVVFVLPSTTYTKQFKDSIKKLQKVFHCL